MVSERCRIPCIHRMKVGSLPKRSCPFHLAFAQPSGPIGHLQPTKIPAGHMVGTFLQDVPVEDRLKGQAPNPPPSRARKASGTFSGVPAALWQGQRDPWVLRESPNPRMKNHERHKRMHKLHKHQPQREIKLNQGQTNKQTTNLRTKGKTIV